MSKLVYAVRGGREGQKVNDHGRELLDAVICCVSCKDAQQRCLNADKPLVSDVIRSDVMSIMENAPVMELRSSEVVPVESRVDESLHQAERRACDERCAEWARDTTFEPSSVTFGFVCGVFWTSGEQIPERCSR